MKKLSLALLTLSLAGCGGNGTSPAFDSALTAAVSPVASPAPTGVPGSTAASLTPVDSRQYLSTAYQDGLVEIALARRALQASSNDTVRSFAQRMIADHVRVNGQLQTLATARGVVLPTTPSAAQTALLAQLGAQTGAAFDRAYARANVDGHEGDVLATRQQADRGTEATVQALANATLPVLEIHLALAREIRDRLDPLAFVTDVYQGGLAEIALSQLALQKSSDAGVRDYAQRMIRQHGQLNAQITGLAKQRALPLPTAPDAVDIEKAAEFARFAGPDFDKAYLDCNVIDHAKDLRLARLVAQDAQDALGTPVQQGSGTAAQRADIANAAGVLVAAFGAHLTAAVDLDRRTPASFLYAVYQQGVESLQVQNLTLLQGTSAALKTSAQQVVTEQTAANAQVRQLAQARSLALPLDASPAILWRFVDLSDATDGRFDQQSISLTVDQYRAEIATVTDQAQNGTDASLRSFAQGLLPVLDAAAARAMLLSQQLGVPATQ